ALLRTQELLLPKRQVCIAGLGSGYSLGKICDLLRERRAFSVQIGEVLLGSGSFVEVDRRRTESSGGADAHQDERALGNGRNVSGNERKASAQKRHRRRGRTPS